MHRLFLYEQWVRARRGVPFFVKMFIIVLKSSWKCRFLFVIYNLEPFDYFHNLFVKKKNFSCPNTEIVHLCYYCCFCILRLFFVSFLTFLQIVLTAVNVCQSIQKLNSIPSKWKQFLASPLCLANFLSFLFHFSPNIPLWNILMRSPIKDFITNGRPQNCLQF